MTIIGDNAFASCYDLKSITYGEEPVNDGEYKFSAALKTVGGEAFKDNPLLRNFIVPDTIESIGTNAFYNAVQSGYHCKDVTVTFYYVNGVIAANILDSQYVWHIVVNDNIHTLSDKAFYNCPVLETISIPDTVSSVGTNVFANPGKNVTATFRGVDGTIDASVYRDNNCTFNVTVIDYIPGDINGDGIVNIKDITR
ncbi:MAG: leucine-rich repeat domain-containing protein, partial [Acutalibacteraceae bacterium]